MMFPDVPPEQQVALQRQGMRYGEITHDVGGFEPAKTVGWYATANMAPNRVPDRPSPFGPVQSRPGPDRPAIILILDVDTPMGDQEMTVIPLERVYSVRQSPVIR